MGLTLSNNKKIYVTYNNKDIEFNKDLIKVNLKPNYINKPTEAFWGSPENAEYGWKEWCESEEFGDYDFNQAFSILNNEKNLIKFKRFINDEFAGINIDDKNINLFGKCDSQIYVFIDYSYQINNEYKKYEAATNKILNNLKAKKNELEHDNTNDEHTKELIKSLEVNLYNANLLINMITEYLTKYSNLDSKINIKLHELNPNGFDFERFHFSKFSYDKFDPDED
jgi:hypothetical protein